MKTVRLIKSQETTQWPAKSENKLAAAAPQETVRSWLSEYQQQKRSNPREQFAQLFKLAA